MLFCEPDAGLLKDQSRDNQCLLEIDSLDSGFSLYFIRPQQVNRVFFPPRTLPDRD